MNSNCSHYNYTVATTLIPTVMQSNCKVIERVYADKSLARLRERERERERRREGEREREREREREGERER